MNGQRQGPVDPDDHGYWASLLSSVRRLRMTSSATSIWAASSGSKAVRRTPSGVSSAYSVSPLPRRRRASSSLGRMTPAELPMAVIFSFMGASGRYNESYIARRAPGLQVKAELVQSRAMRRRGVQMYTHEPHRLPQIGRAHV